MLMLLILMRMKMIDAEHFSRLNCFAEHECWKEMEIIIVFKKQDEVF